MWADNVTNALGKSPECFLITFPDSDQNEDEGYN